eukprot:gene8695-9413_t
MLLFIFAFFTLFHSLNGDYEQALQYYYNAVKLHSSQPYEAITLYEQAIKEHISFPEAHQNLGILYEQRGNFETASYHHHLAYDYSIQLNYPIQFQIQSKSNYISSQLKFNTLSINLQIHSWIKECEQLYEKVLITLQQNDKKAIEKTGIIDILFLLGLLYQKIEYYQKSVDYFQEIIQHYSENHILSWLNIGNTFFSFRQYNQAIYYYSIALDLSKKQLLINYQFHYPNVSFDDLMSSSSSSSSSWSFPSFSLSSFYYEREILLNGIFRQDYFNILAICNNLAQSYREIGLFHESIQTFSQGYYYSRLLYYMNHPEEIIYNDDNNNIKNKNRRFLSTSNLHFMITLYTMKGFLNDWKEYEFIEHLLLQQIYYSQDLLLSYHYDDDISIKNLHSDPYNVGHSRDSADSGDGGGDCRKEEKKVTTTALLIGNKNEQGNSIFDPYTLSLLRYASSEVDLFVTQQNCPMNLFSPDSNNHRGSQMSHQLYQTDRESHRISSLLTLIHQRNQKTEELHTLEGVYEIESNVKTDDFNRRVAVRVGFLSFDWRDHPMGRLTAGIVTNTNQTQLPNSFIEFYCFSYGFNDASEIRNYIEKHCHHFIDISILTTDYSIAQTISSYNIDILIDITSHTYHNRMNILSFRPSALTINYLGYPGTTGCISSGYLRLADVNGHENVEKEEKKEVEKEEQRQDYFQYPILNEYNYSFLDLFVAPPDYLIQRAKMKINKSKERRNLKGGLQQSHTNHKNQDYYRIFSEKIMYLPFSYQSNYMPITTIFARNLHSANSLPSLIMSSSFEKEQQQGGGRRQQHVFPIIKTCLLNANKKFEPSYFHLLTNLLQEHRELILIILDVPLQSQEQLLLQFAFYGITSSSQKMKRIRFINREKWMIHLSRVSRECDIVLDTFVYGGHTTSTDVLWMGVPIITMKGYGLSNGARMPSRVASSLLHNIDINPQHSDQPSSSLASLLVMDTVKDYENAIKQLIPRIRTNKDSNQITTGVNSNSIKLQLLQRRIRAITCESYNFDLSNVQRRIFHYIYHLLYEQHIFKEFLQNNLISSNYPYSYHFILLKEFFIPSTKSSSSSPPSSLSYCEQEAMTLLSHDQNDVSFHGRLTHPFISYAVLQRLSFPSPNSFLKELQGEFRNRIIKQTILRLFGFEMLPNSSFHEFPTQNLLNQTLFIKRVVSLMNEDLNFYRTITTNCSYNVYDDDNEFCLVKEVLPLSTHMILVSFKSLSENLTAFPLDFSIQLYRWLMEAIDQFSSQVRAPLAPTSEITSFFARFRADVEDYSCRSLMKMIFMDKDRQRVSENESKLIVHVLSDSSKNDIQWEMMHDLLSKDSTKILSLQAYSFLLHRVFSSLLTLFMGSELPREIIIPINVVSAHNFSIKSLEFLQSFLEEIIQNDIKQFQNVQNFLHNSSLIMEKSLFRKFFLHNYYMILLIGEMRIKAKGILINHFNTQNVQEEKMKLENLYKHLLGLQYEKLFHFGIHWNEHIASAFTSFSKFTFPVKEEFHLKEFFQTSIKIGYILQSIGNRLLIAEKQSLFNPYYKFHHDFDEVREDKSVFKEDDDDHEFTQRKLYRKELEKKEIEFFSNYSIINNNFIIVFYCYEYGQEWWPEWGPSFFPSSFHTPNISTLFNPKQNLSNIEKEGTDQFEGRALGGSEEAVTYLAYELAKFGYSIEIYTSDLPLKDRYFTSYTNVRSGNDSLHPRKIGKIQWFHYLDYAVERQDVDVFIAWRYALSLSLARNAKKRFLWLHDLVPITSLPPVNYLIVDNSSSISSSSYLDYIFVQSSFHQRFILQEYKKSYHHDYRVNISEKVLILPNGVHTLPSSSTLFDETYTDKDENYIITREKNRGKIFIYSSAPNRGLEIVLSLWPYIYQIDSNLKLWIFYGFTSKVITRLEKQMGENSFQKWFKRIENLLNQPGIHYYGAVSHQQLQMYLQKGGFFLYPSSFPETGCISMMRAMIAGVVPITSRYQSSVLATLGESFDFGPSNKTEKNIYVDGHKNCLSEETFSALNDEILSNLTCYHEWIRKDYLESIYRAIRIQKKDYLSFYQLRERMSRVMGEKYSWLSSAKTINTLINNE